MPPPAQRTASEHLRALTPQVEGDDAARLDALRARRDWGPESAAGLSALCHALLQLEGQELGGRSACGEARALAFQLYRLERAHDVPPARSTLYRGALQIASGGVELGLKNVLHAARLGLEPREACVAAWARASAAVHLRRLRAALDACEDWLAGATAAELEEDAVRAQLARALLAFVVDDPVEAPECAPPWDAVRAAVLDPAAPWPAQAPLLFLGVPARPSGERDRDAFAQLCAERRERPSPVQLDEEQLLGLIDLLAHWDVAAPLEACMQELRRRDPDAYAQALLARQLGEHAARDLLSGELGEQVVVCPDATVLMADVRGYTAASEVLSGGAVHGSLSPLFRTLGEELEPAGGMILEFVGDAVMVVFNAFPDQRTEVLELLNAVATCIERLNLQGALARANGAPELRLGLGLHRGPVDRGLVGGLERCHLAVLGSTVNVAARLEALTRELPAPMVLSRAVLGGAPAFHVDPAGVGFSLRDLGAHPLKGVSEPVQTYGLDALIREWVDFVPMGLVARAEPGVVYLDTGCGYGPGLVDSHRPEVTGDPEQDGADLRSTCSAVLAHPEYVLDHLGVDPDDTLRAPVEFRVHSQPDLDCAASLAVCYELLRPRARHALLRALADYVSDVDEGRVPDPEAIADSLYGVFVAHQELERRAGRRSDRDQLRAGLRVVDAALLLAEATGAPLSRVFASEPAWFGAERNLLRADRVTYSERDLPRSQVYRAFVHGAGEVDGLWLDHPESLLFKHWARTDPQAPGGQGYPFMSVDWSNAERGRFVISVAPDAGLHLDGLGQALEGEEKRGRAELGQPRPTEPRRYPADNADPWYFGQGHGHTIVDAPSGGTVLDAEAVRRIHMEWRP